MRFNATVYFDKEKSWVKPQSEWEEGSEVLYNQFPKVLKLKFDYYEYVVRQFRKHLKENEKELNQEDIKPILQSHYDKAEKEWDEIFKKLNYDFSETKLLEIRLIIDNGLNELKDFDSSLNSVFN
jgi:hypothetical protein